MPYNHAGLQANQRKVQSNNYNVSVENTREDLTKDLPLYPFSCYGPGVNAPKQLIEGDIEQSPEELRVKCYLAQANGQLEQYQAYEQKLYAEAKAKVETIKNNLQQAVQYAIDIAPPNRNDQCIKPKGPFPRGQSQPQPAPSVGGFGQTSQPSTGFGAPSQLGTARRAAFGAASPMGGGASSFGNPSSLGGGGGFGQASQLGGGGAATGFGAPSALGQAKPFGSGALAAPSPLMPAVQSTPAFGQSGFGAASKPAFGQTGFGGGAQQPAASPFAQAAQPSGGGFGSQQQQQPAPSGFGASSAPAFGQSGFGAASQAQSAASPFAQAAQAAPSSGGFGSASQPAPSAFGQHSQSAAAPSNPFAARPAQPANGFGSGGGFGAPTAPALLSSSSNPLAPRPNPPAATLQQQQPGQLVPMPTHWKGQRIVFDEKVKDGKTSRIPCFEVRDPSYKSGVRLERIWFPQGGPQGPAPMTEAADPSVYQDPDLGPRLRAAYEYANQHGVFKDGLIPEIAPKREWVDFDF